MLWEVLLDKNGESRNLCLPSLITSNLLKLQNQDMLLISTRRKDKDLVTLHQNGEIILTNQLRSSIFVLFIPIYPRMLSKGSRQRQKPFSLEQKSRNSNCQNQISPNSIQCKAQTDKNTTMQQN